jgi:hypothetical protein
MIDLSTAGLVWQTALRDDTIRVGSLYEEFALRVLRTKGA